MAHLAGLDLLGMLLVSLGAALVTAGTLVVWRRREPAPVRPAPAGQHVDLVLDTEVAPSAEPAPRDVAGLERRLEDLARRVDRIASRRRRKP